MVKKSGNFIRPVLKTLHQPSSNPTITAGKVVRFDDTHLEQVRPFLSCDRPVAVGSSDNTFCSLGLQWGRDRDPKLFTRELAVALDTASLDTPTSRSQPVRLERLWVPTGHRLLHGSVVLANLAYEKEVVCRFTTDSWNTVSEVTADYITPNSAQPISTVYDHFIFNIDISNLKHIESKTFQCCIRYKVLGYEYWDNNNGDNFEFTLGSLPCRGKPTQLLPNATPQRSEKLNQIVWQEKAWRSRYSLNSALVDATHTNMYLLSRQISTC